MYKQYLRSVLVRIKPVKTWYLLVACLVSGAVCALALRSNYVHMTDLRAAVYTADQQNGNVEAALQALRSYVGRHMNTSLATSDGVYPPIQLKYTYQRLQQAEAARVQAVNSQIYTQAQKLCEAQYPTGFSGGVRVPCIDDYVQQHGTTAQPIAQDMYKFDFVSPRWSPDLAGWALALTILLFGLAVLRFALGRVLQWLSR
ncbi:MAG TPA: hypothetical protein VLF91_02100 [Candidatus Saccharimonadales bacterium]|nr:hypothetical protein [Candidatus Saccharimonadales bacterium]